MEEIFRGAEAVLYSDNNKIIKERVSKRYRHIKIDERIRKICTRREVKLLGKASSLIKVPVVYNNDEKKMSIVMEKIDGVKVRDVLDNFDKDEREKICKEIGRSVAILHNNSIIHGDLTTSNFLLGNGEIYFIDFGLGLFSSKIEDKAVDLHLLKQALNSKHFKIAGEGFNAILEGYKNESRDFGEVIERFNKAESRGRYKRKGF